jgi:hypothetical protein
MDGDDEEISSNLKGSLMCQSTGRDSLSGIARVHPFKVKWMIPLELPAIKIFAKRFMAPATENFYGEAGVLLATDYGGRKISHELANFMAE